MKILVYSAMNAETVLHNFGEPEYSYYFVLREFMPLLRQFGDVQVVHDPATEVDPLSRRTRQTALSFPELLASPPHHSGAGLPDCPGICLGVQQHA